MALDKVFGIFSIIISIMLMTNSCASTPSGDLSSQDLSQFADDEADDAVNAEEDYDPLNDVTTAFANQPYPVNEEAIESLETPAIIDELPDEYLYLIEQEIASQTVRELVTKLRETLTKEPSIESIMQVAREITSFMTRKRSPENVRKYLRNRLNYYINGNTPDYIRNYMKKINRFVNNKNVPKHLNYANKAIVDFLGNPNIREIIAEKVALIDRLIMLSSLA